MPLFTYFGGRMKTPAQLALLLLLSFTLKAQLPAASVLNNATPPAGFLKNIGQVKDFHNKPVDYVYYQANIAGQQIFVTRYGLSILLARPKQMKWMPTKSPHGKTNDSANIVDWEVERIDIVPEGGSISLNNITTSVKPGSPYINFYLSSTVSAMNRQQVQNELIIRDVYKGIDWKIYLDGQDGNHPHLKYDFIVHPGADASLIQLKYSKNARLSLHDGEIEARTNMGVLREKKPYSYLRNTKEEVPVAFSLKNNTISFAAQPYDTKETLVIDPSIFWLTYLSATNNVFSPSAITGSDIETDAAGNMFVQLSLRWGVQFPTVNPGNGAYFQTLSSTPDGSMFICKFAPGGKLLWSTYFGSGTKARHMTVDNAGNLYAIGQLEWGIPNYPINNQVVPLKDNGGFFISQKKEYFIAKFSNSGVLQWSSFYFNFESYPTDMSFDQSGNIYVTGWSKVFDFPTVDPGGGAYCVTNPKYGYAQTLFIAQFNAANQLTWSTRIEGNDYDPHARVCTDKSGNIYLGGQLRSTTYPLVNAGGYFNSSAGGDVLMRFNPARQMTWSTRIPFGSYGFYDLTVDDSSNVYVAHGRKLIKFNSQTNLVYQIEVPTTRMYSWRKIQFDPVHDQIWLLGIMNDSYIGFPTVNATCNNSFFDDGQPPNIFAGAAIGPIFSTCTRDGVVTYRSLVDWSYEYYEYNEMSVDPFGNPVYLFGFLTNGTIPNPQLTNPGNGAYFDPNCCNTLNHNLSAMLMKLIASQMSIDTIVTKGTNCNCDASVTATASCGSPPYQYLWSNGSTSATVNNLCPGTHWVKVTDASNASRTLTVRIPYPPGSISDAFSEVKPENCNHSNGSIQVKTVQGGTAPYNYSIDGTNYQASSKFSNLSSGSYYVRIRDANGCQFIDTVVLNAVQGPSNVVYQAYKTRCDVNDGRLQVTSVTGGTGPYTYTLNGGAVNTTGIFKDLAAGNYLLAIADTAGCQLSRNVVIEKAPPPSSALFTSNNDHCNQQIGFIQVNSATGGLAPYTYSTDSILFVSGTINNLGRGNYPLYVRDANGCVLKLGPVVVNNEEGPANMTSTINHAYCGELDGKITVAAVQGGVSPYQYALDGGGFGPNNSFDRILPGSHAVAVRDQFGCILNNTFQVDYKPLPVINLFPADTTVCYDSQLFLKLDGAVDQLSSINWSIPAERTTANLKVIDSRQVIVRMRDVNDCLFNDTARIQVKACSTPEKCIAIPNAFTPNGDLSNDRIGPILNGCRVNEIQFRIYNRWGQLIYETSAPGTGWDGSWKGLPQPAGTYVYTCTYIGADSVKRVIKGSFVLLR